MTTLAERLCTVIKEKGWLAVSNVYFDNASVCNIGNSLGYVAISEADNTMFWLSCMDTVDSDLTEQNYVHVDPHNIGHQQTLMAQDLDCLQHLEYALFMHSNFYWDEQEKFPLPSIPTRATIEGLTADENGLYPGTDTLLYSKAPMFGNSDQLQKSVISLFTDDQFKDPELSNTRKFLTTSKPIHASADYPRALSSTYFGSAVNVDKWKAFYKNQTKFVQALNEYLGITDAF